MVPVYHGRVQACIFDWAGNLLWSDISAYNLEIIWFRWSLTESFNFLITTIDANLGTVCDAGVFAPVLSFQKLFEAEGVPITDAETRAPMGVHKRVMK